MAFKYGETWGSQMKCQQFSRSFVTDGLGWPRDIDVSGDYMPMFIDISVLFLSLKIV